MKTYFLTICLLLIIQSVQSQTQTKVTEPVIDKEKTIKWLEQNAIPIKTINYGNGFDDLKPLKNVLKNVKIVGLGEATHGTKEFFTMKHRMIEFLVTELGFKILAMEFNYNGSQIINDYILNGKGDVYSALKSQGLMVWNTEEIIELLEWLRKYNENVPLENKVIVKGLDIRCNYIGDNFTSIKNYLNKVDPNSSQQNDSLLNEIKRLDLGLSQGTNVDSSKNEYLKLLANLSIRKGNFIQHSSQQEYNDIFDRMKTIGQNLCMNYVKIEDPRELYYQKTRLRDYFMASNFMDLYQQNKDKRIIVWAHNMHIAKTNPEQTDDIRMLGNYIKEAYKDDYYSIGFSFDKGSFQTFEYSDERKPLGMQEFVVKDNHPNTIDWYMSQTGLNPFIINFRSEKLPDFMVNFLDSRLLTRRIGGEAIRSRVEMMNGFCTLRLAYDGLVFINNTTRATPIKK